MVQIEYQENKLAYEDYIHLRQSVDWVNQPEQQTRVALSRSMYTITALHEGMTIGMGSSILDQLLGLVIKETPPGCRISVQLIAEKEKEGFYGKKGFKKIPHEFCGSGMRKVIHT